MPISSTNRKAGPFPGDGVQDTFPFEFKVFSDADLLVVRADSNGAEYTLVLTTDYTVTLNPDQEVDPGGDVVLVTPLPLLESVVVTSDMANLQPIDITNQGGFYPAVMNSALDRLTILSQQLEEKVSRSIKVTLTSALTPDEFVQELQQGASEASASAAAAAASAVLAETFVPAGYAQLAGADFTGPVSMTDLLSADGGVEVPAGATGAQAPQAQETAMLATTQLGFRNKVVNGNFAINQGAVSGSVVLAAGAYGHDQWKAGASGCTYTFSASGGVNTLTISAGSLIQPIEGVSLRTGTHTLSWTGTSQGKIDAGSYGASGLTGSITGGADTSIEFNTGTLSLVQLERGDRATVFEFLDPTTDFLRCARFYEKGWFQITGNHPSSAGFGGSAYYKATKRVNPTVTAVYTNVGVTGMGTVGSTPDCIRFFGTGGTGAVQITANWTSNARI